MAFPKLVLSCSVLNCKSKYSRIFLRAIKNSSIRYLANIDTKNSAEELVIIEVESNLGIIYLNADLQKQRVR